MDPGGKQLRTSADTSVTKVALVIAVAKVTENLCSMEEKESVPTLLAPQSIETPLWAIRS
jgi:hypothetical protein